MSGHATRQLPNPTHRIEAQAPVPPCPANARQMGIFEHLPLRQGSNLLAVSARNGPRISIKF